MPTLKMTVTKTSGQVTLASPDCCYTPGVVGGGGPKPLPYPPYATTATKVRTAGATPAAPALPGAQKTPVAPKTGLQSGGSNFVVMGAPKMMREGAMVAITPSPTLSNRNNEIAQLKSNLDSLNTKLKSLQSGDANEWQAVLQDYAVVAGALYLTLNSDD